MNAVFITVRTDIRCYHMVYNLRSIIRAAGVNALVAFFLAFTLLR